MFHLYILPPPFYATNSSIQTMGKASEKSKPTFPLQYVKGIGPARAAALAEEGVHTISDLLLYTPRAYLDRRTVLTLRKTCMLLAGEEGVPDEVTVLVEIKRMNVPVGRSGRKPLVMRVADATGEANLVFFQGVRYFARAYQPGELLAISGPPEIYEGVLQWIHPEVEKMKREENELIHSGRIIPRYRETQKMKSVGLSSRSIRKLIETVFEKYVKEELKERLSDRLLEEHNLLPKEDAIRQLHFPDSEERLERARYRMKFEELFFFELGLAFRKETVKTEQPGIAFNVQGELARKLLESLSFELTGAQKRALKEILDNMGSPQPMNRLLQGDVGSGKTIVSLLAMLVAIDNGYQCAMMAPTEILAEQHAQTLRRTLEGFPIKIEQLVGGLKKRVRENLLYDLRNNNVQILVGTHALFQDDVEFAKLGFVVIDEQHRFGVKERAALMEKGAMPDTLIMSATPIPRTLTMTLYGDLDVSVIDELPANRKPIKTAIRFESAVDSLWDFVRHEVREGRQVYIVYPLVEKSEKLELKSAVEHYEYHKETNFPDLRLGLLHGQMFWYEKEEIMQDFLEKKIDVLIATTVVEVGIDIPNASVMVIENAERFGLSQLHQLRGRVGRGKDQSYCMLITKDHFRYQMRRGMPQNEQRKERAASIRRLQAMVDTTDGFKISEIDLELRGPGDMVGTRQSGIPEFDHVNLITDGPIIAEAREAAFALAKDDPKLNKPENRPIRDAYLGAMKRSLKYAEVG